MMRTNAVVHSGSQEPATIAHALREGQQILEAAGSVTPRLDAEILLRHVLGLDRTALFARLGEPAVPDVLAAFRALLAKRATGVPVAYITGEREFMGLPFLVSPGVLVPRPETEILVEWALRWLHDRDHATVVDVGAGSGVIALSIAALAEPGWSGRVIASDVSPMALSVATRNRERLGLEDRVELVQGSLLAWRNDPVDLLLANLPYLRPEQIAGNQQLVAEPRIALEGGHDGLDLVRELLADAPRILSPGGALGLEIDPAQSPSVVELANEAFAGAKVTILRDLAGFDRHVIVETPAPR